jgi:threonine/homoserine/homoserine lactone efflux protein
MDLAVFGRGFGLGFSIAAVLGPIGVLCLRRSLVSGFWIGLVSGLGAATADATYGAIAAFGVSALASLLVEQRLWLHLVGGAFLIYLGVQALRAAPALVGATDGAHADARPPGCVDDAIGQRARGQAMEVLRRGRRLAVAYASTLLLTLSNPMTILSFGAIFAGLGIGALEAGSPGAALVLVLGVFSGSAAWWLVLASAAARLRRFITSRRLRWVNIASGLLIVGFGVQALIAVVADLAP